MGNPGWVKAKHLQLEKIKNMKRLLIFIFILSSGMAVKFSFEPELPRQEKSLLNTFPFNNQEDGVESNLSQSFKQPQIQLDARNFRQGSEINGVSFNEVSQAGPGGDGKKCIDKVEMVEETEYDDVVQCDH